MSYIACSNAIASVIVNDYFDFAFGTDTINIADKPIPRGTIKSDSALLLTLIIYVSELAVACFIDNPALRFIYK